MHGWHQRPGDNAWRRAEGSSVLHRDIKPGNIFLRRSASAGLMPDVVFGDLGFATWEIGSDGAMGTPGYDAPELQPFLDDVSPRIADRGQRVVTPACDVYALGATLYRLMTLTERQQDGTWYKHNADNLFMWNNGEAIKYSADLWTIVHQMVVDVQVRLPSKELGSVINHAEKRLADMGSAATLELEKRRDLPWPQNLGVPWLTASFSQLPHTKTYPSVLDYHEAYKSGRLTPTDVAEALLPLIQRDVEKPNKHSVAFMETRVDLVRRTAAESTARYKAGKPLSPLDGVPVAYKDQLDLTGYKQRTGTKLDLTHKDDVTTYCALPWQQAGAIVVGKLNMHELGMDTTNLNPNWGTPLNPYNDSYYTGGSSGGSGYVLASGLVPVAHGADGGGSIRIPSGFCGVYGLKPTHARVGTRPSPNLATSVGVHGPMAANMVDLEIAYRLMAHPDAEDPINSQFMPPSSVMKLKDRTKTLGIDRAWFNRADPDVRDTCQRAVDWLVSNAGYTVVEIDLSMLHEAQLAHAISIMIEVMSHLPDHSQWTMPNKILTALFGQASAVDLMQSMKVRTVLMEHLAHLFTRFPGLIIVTPTTPNAGWKITPGELLYGASNGNMSVKTMTYVGVANFAGVPAINVPAGYVEEKGGALPIGLMGMGEWCTDEELLAFGYDCERYLHEAVEYGRRLPPNFVDVLGLARGVAPKTT
ncbi:hypothetical protein AMS68_003944 [Peltaster fructicola]|uniref:Protein kinase domain-containing protein n=1 Tax=Peltaster fructicola TaxID=286661 RepID=A0A6H0XUJ0_9PEZI|nr:hypothetical protein AMS68_003944 [Peltaster fructicola]